MSLFRPERLCVGLAPERITIVRVATGRVPRALSDTAVAADLNPRAPQLAPLFEGINVMRAGARDVQIVLADPLVRYFVTEAPQGLRSRAELRGAIDARFEEQFGLSLAEWEICTDLAPGCDSYLACAVPRKLLAGLRDGCLAAKLGLRGLAPFAVSEMNRWHRRLPKRDFWFAAAGHGALTLGYRAKRGWRGMRTHTANGKAEAQLPVLLERDGLRLGVAGEAPLHCSGLVSQPVESASSDVLTRVGAGLWPGQAEAWSREYRLALSGVWL